MMLKIMEPDWKNKKWDVSAIGGAFGVNARDCREGCESFMRAVIPTSWKAELVFGGLWEEAESGSYGQMSHVIRLSKFPFSFRFNGKIDEADAFHRETYKKIRNILWDWIFKKEAIEFPTPSGGGIWAGRGHWFVNYQLDDFEGTFLTWILPASRTSEATLIASLIEARRHRNRPRAITE